MQLRSKHEWSDEQEQEYLKDLDEKKAEKRKALAERKELSEKSKPKRLSKKEAAERQARVLDKSGEGGIIEARVLTKLNNDNSISNPMDAQRYNTMKANLEKRGCSVAYQALQLFLKKSYITLR